MPRMCERIWPLLSVAPRANELCLQTDARELVYKPSCAVLQLFFVLVIRRNTGKPKERIILLKVIVAHGQKLIGFRCLPTISAQFNADEIQNRSGRQHNSCHDKLASRG